jgi:tape measure domain-containing protein
MTDITQLGIGIDTRGHEVAVQNLGKVDNAVKQTAAETTKMGIVMGAAQAATTAALSALTTVAGAAVGAAGGVLKLSSDLQQANLAFTTMLGSAEAAEGFLDQLKTFAAETPFEFPDLVRASQTMLRFGVNAKDILPTLQAVGDVVASGSQMSAATIDRVTLALGQMQAKGKVTGEEMMQLVEAGVPAWDFLAKELGTNVAGAMQKVEDRTVSSDKMFAALQHGAAAEFGGMMQRQSQTAQGAMSTLMDTVKMAAVDGFQPLFAAIEKVVVGLANFAGSTEGKAFIEDLVTNAQDASKAFLGFLSSIQGIGGQIMAQLADPIRSVQSAWDQMQPGVERLKGLFAGFVEGVQTAFGQLRSVWESLTGPADESAGSLGRVATVIAGFFNNVMVPSIERSAQVWGTVWAFMSEHAVQAWNDFQPTLTQIVAWWDDTLFPALQAGAEAWKTTWNYLSQVIELAWGVISPILGFLKDRVVDTFVSMFQTVKGVIEFLAPILRQVGGVVGEAFGAAGEAIDQVLAMIVPNVAHASEEAGETFKQNITRGTAPAIKSMDEFGNSVEDTGKKGKKAAFDLNTLPEKVKGVADAATQAKEQLEAFKKAQESIKTQNELLLISTNASTVATGMWNAQLRSFVEGSLKDLPIELAAAAQAQLNANNVNGAAVTVNNALGISYQTMVGKINGNAVAERELSDAREKAKTAALGGAIAVRAYAEDQERAKTAALGGSVAVRAHTEDLEDEKVAELGGHAAIQKHNDEREREKRAALGGEEGIRRHTEQLEDEKVAELGGYRTIQQHNDEREREKRAALGGEAGVRAHTEALEDEKVAELGGHAAMRDHNEQREREKTAALGGEAGIRTHTEALEQNKIAALGGERAIKAHNDQLALQKAFATDAASALSELDRQTKASAENQVAAAVLAGQITRTQAREMMAQWEDAYNGVDHSSKAATASVTTAASSMAAGVASSTREMTSSMTAGAQQMVVIAGQYAENFKHVTTAAQQAAGAVQGLVGGPNSANPGGLTSPTPYGGVVIDPRTGQPTNAGPNDTIKGGPSSAGGTVQQDYRWVKIGGRWTLIPVDELARAIEAGAPSPSNITGYGGFGGMMVPGASGQGPGISPIGAGLFSGGGVSGFGGMRDAIAEVGSGFVVVTEEAGSATEAVGELGGAVGNVGQGAVSMGHDTAGAFEAATQGARRWDEVLANTSGMLYTVTDATRTVESAAVVAGRAFDNMGQKAAQIFLTTEQHMAVLKQRAQDLANAISRTAFGTTSVGLNYTQIYNQPQPTTSSTTTRNFASGGWITEPVSGVGAWSGSRYNIAERRPEFVDNGGGGGGGPRELHIHVHPQDMPLGVMSTSEMKTRMDELADRWVIPAIERRLGRSMVG